jgi:hypothetical protein
VGYPLGMDSPFQYLCQKDMRNKDRTFGKIEKRDAGSEIKIIKVP